MIGGPLPMSREDSMRRKTAVTGLLFLLSMLSAGAEAFSTKEGKILNNAGQEVSIDGAAWIGFMDNNVLGGLWSSSVFLNAFKGAPGVMDDFTHPWQVAGSGVSSEKN